MGKRDEVMPMAQVIEPRSIAILGASEDYRKFGGRITHHLLEHGYAGKVYAINRKRDEVLGLKCYPTLQDLPELPDMVLLAVPATSLEESVIACGEAGVGVCVVLTAQLGEFSEEGKALEQRIVEIAHGYNMRIVGPNCMGMIVPSVNMALSSTPTLRYSETMPKGRVALVSQSGAFMGLLYLVAYDHGVGLSGMVSIGNQADLEMCDFLEAFLEHDGTDIICLYVEGLKSPARFRELCLRARAAGKRVLAVKAGRTEAGTVMARSHTSSLAGSYSAFETLCREAGVLLLDEPESMVLCAGLLAGNVRSDGSNLGVVCASGGGGSIMADRLSLNGLQLAEYAPETRKKLSVAYKPHHQNNPLDIGAHFGPADADHIRRSIDAVHDDPNVDVFVYALTPQPMLDETVDHLIEVWKRKEKPVILMMNMYRFGDDQRAKVLASGLPFVARTDDLYRALNLFETDRKADGLLRPDDLKRPSDLQIVQTVDEGFLTEPQAKEILRSYGVPVPSAHVMRDVDAGAEKARSIGYPVVLKGVVADVVHKSDQGLVKVGIADDDELKSAWTEIANAISKANPGAEIRIDVQQMIGSGVELVVGLTNEEGFGPQLVLGAGGIHVELLKDVAQLRAPVTAEEVRTMLQSLRIWPLLSGARGQAAPDVDKACEVIARLSWLGEDLADRLVDFEVNPMRITTEGVYALDGRGTLAQS